MISVLKKTLDAVFGAGEAAVTVPPLDGAFQPNTALEAAPCVASVAAPDNLVAEEGHIFFSSHADLLELGAGDAAQTVATFPAPITALAGNGRGTLAVAVAGQGIILRTVAGMRTVPADAFAGAGCITALAFAADGRLVAASGSTRDGADGWARNLLERRYDGAVWSIDTDRGAATRLADGLGWPSGILIGSDGRIVVAEAWRHRLIALSPERKAPAVLLDNLPAYPGRLLATADAVWLACFAPRSQLIEFVLREKSFRARMVSEVPAEFWVAPALASGRSFREPLQGGAVKQLGVLKPWAPTRSYGLLVCLDRDFNPRRSFHSRADGNRHGITSVVPVVDGLLVTAKGGDAVLRLDAVTARREDGK